MFRFDNIGNCLNPEVLYCKWAPSQPVKGKSSTTAHFRGEVKIEICSDGRLCTFGGVITGNKMGMSHSTGFNHLMQDKHTEYGYDQWNDEKYLPQFISYSREDVEVKAIAYFQEKIKELTKRNKDDITLFNHFFRWIEGRNQIKMEL